MSAGDGAFAAAVLRSARGVKLMSDNASPEGMQLNRSLLVGGGVLVGIGGLLGFTGMALVMARSRLSAWDRCCLLVSLVHAPTMPQVPLR